MIQSLFQLTFLLTVPCWGLMIFAPTWSVTHRVVSSPWIMVPPLVVYLFQALPVFGDLWAAVSRPDLAVLQTFLATPAGAAAIWAQVIAWDLFIGRWMYLDSRERGLHPLLMAPLLVFTILLSPIGVLIYLGLRTTARVPSH
ncbi:ABA4-like family protein [Kutzneria sp. NPDC052558]|uniref:ABA4-like family protein n=1 Tax=Kutzneria sp. NPDC052558 TaxID=3364121 RepID=UPI0037CABC64